MPSFLQNILTSNKEQEESSDDAFDAEVRNQVFQALLPNYPDLTDEIILSILIHKQLQKDNPDDDDSIMAQDVSFCYQFLWGEKQADLCVYELGRLQYYWSRLRLFF